MCCKFFSYFTILIQYVYILFYKSNIVVWKYVLINFIYRLLFDFISFILKHVFADLHYMVAWQYTSNAKILGEGIEYSMKLINRIHHIFLGVSDLIC